jgi:hypothetical protein
MERKRNPEDAPKARGTTMRALVRAWAQYLPYRAIALLETGHIVFTGNHEPVGRSRTRLKHLPVPGLHVTVEAALLRRTQKYFTAVAGERSHSDLQGGRRIFVGLKPRTVLEILLTERRP